jgi:hypothetical protein
VSHVRHATTIPEAREPERVARANLGREIVRNTIVVWPEQACGTGARARAQHPPNPLTDKVGQIWLLALRLCQVNPTTGIRDATRFLRVYSGCALPAPSSRARWCRSFRRTVAPNGCAERLRRTVAGCLRSHGGVYLESSYLMFGSHMTCLRSTFRVAEVWNSHNLDSLSLVRGSLCSSQISSFNPVYVRDCYRRH